jgi:hypothetical protein
MAVVQGIKERVHLPLYDSVSVKREEQLQDDQRSSTLKFFVDVQGKTKLETNLQSASQLSHYNTFEARAMRVVVSDLRPEFPEDPTAEDTDFDVTDEDENLFYLDESDKVGAVDSNNMPVPGEFEDGFTFNSNAKQITADIEVGLDRIVELLQEARDSDDGFTELSPTDEEVTLFAGEDEQDDDVAKKLEDFGATIFISTSDLEFLLSKIPDKNTPPEFQIDPDRGTTEFINKLIYNTVTTLIVGEKEMMKAPTFFFPSGSGVFNGHAASNGEPDPMATFRFAEAINIDKLQNFRVEIEVPDSDVFKELQRVYGPLFIWVVLDGYLTRDVQ